MQAYALQTILKRLGHEVLTEDRRCMRDFTFKGHLKDCLKIIVSPFLNRYTPTIEELAFITEKTDKFIKNYIDTTVPVYSSDKKILNLYEFDAYIVGSDQVWRPCCSPGIYDYFLEFIENSNVKKIAYAASFGTDRWEYTEEQTIRCRKLIQKFDAVSVREDTGVQLCKCNLGMEATHVLDPTMLLDKADYIHIVEEDFDASKGCPKGVWAYIMDKSNEKRDIISHICQITCLHLIEPNPAFPTKNIYTDGHSAIKSCVFPSVQEWLKGFANANFVVTDSFHGTVFSIIFNVPFIAIANKGRGLSRFSSLLKMFGLENRLVNSLDELTEKLIKEPIDFTNTNEILAEKRKFALDFLISNLERNKERPHYKTC